MLIRATIVSNATVLSELVMAIYSPGAPSKTKILCIATARTAFGTWQNCRTSDLADRRGIDLNQGLIDRPALAGHPWVCLLFSGALTPV